MEARKLTAELKVFREVGMLHLWRFGIGRAKQLASIRRLAATATTISASLNI
jgi:hypothetical protein